MTLKLTKEITDALHANGPDGLELIDPETGRVYMIVDGEVYRHTLATLHQQQDHDAVAEGIAQMEAGEGRPAVEVFDGIRERLGFPQRP